MLNKAIELSNLWEQVCLGNEKAYSSLHYQLYPGLFVYAKNITKDEDVTHDLVQELFIKLWTKKAIIGQIANVKAYFYRATRSIVINHLRSIKNQESKLNSMVSVDIQFSAEDIITTEETSLELKRSIEGALNKLPSRQREIIYLRFYEDMDYTQIVAVTGIKYQSVVNHVYRAVQVMRDSLTATGKLTAA